MVDSEFTQSVVGMKTCTKIKRQEIECLLQLRVGLFLVYSTTQMLFQTFSAAIFFSQCKPSHLQALKCVQLKQLKRLNISL